MVGRNKFIEDLVSQISEMSALIEEREAVEPDLAIVRELADQLLEEVQSLDES